MDASAMAEDGPDVIRWLIHAGMQFEQTASGDLHTRKAGGMSAARIVHCRDYTGLEMMRVLRESVIQHRSIEVWEHSPAVELLSNEIGQKCVGAVFKSLSDGRFRMVRTHSVILDLSGSFPELLHASSGRHGLLIYCLADGSCL